MNQEDIRASFIRQRRNLMAISIVNLFVTLSGIKLNKLNLLGSDFDISRPQIITISLWIAFAYWLIRYFQLLHDSGNLDIQLKYASTVYWPTANLATPILHQTVQKSIAEESGQLSSEITLQNMSWKIPPSILNPFSKRVLSCSVNYQIKFQDGTTRSRSLTTEIEISPQTKFFLTTWADGAWQVALKTSLVTEYVLPPILAVVVLVICVVQRYFTIW